MMRIVIITQGLSPIVEPLNKAHSVVGVVEARSPKQKTNKPHSAWSVLTSLRKGYRPNRVCTLKNYCAKASIPYWYMSDGCSVALQKWMNDLHPDLVCVYSMSELLRENIYRIPRCGTINLHPSLLPKYRGPNPYFWILLNEEKESGATIHYIDKGEDTGNILAQEAFSVSDAMTMSELRSASVNLGVQLMLGVIDRLENGSVATVRQPLNSPTVRARRVKPGEYHSLIQWEEWPSARIRRLFKREVVKIADLFPEASGHFWWDWKIQDVTPQTPATQRPGTFQVDAGVFTLFCKDGSIRFVRRFVGIKQVVRALIGKLL